MTTLSGGRSIRNELPDIGLGTWQNDDPETCAETVQTALELGYRHIDTAKIYGNESAIGRGIAASDVDRDDVFLATKVWNADLGGGDVIDAVRESLDRLGVESLDLLYVHWPAGKYAPSETLPAFEKLHGDGVIDRIGVSNFERDDLETARSILETPIFANQIELHPLFQQRELRTFCADAGIEVVAYSPLARGRVFEDPTLSEIADAHSVSEAQVSLAWLRSKDVTAIPKATSTAHLRDNQASLELTLTDGEIERIDAIDTQKRIITPDFAPDSW